MGRKLALTVLLVMMVSGCGRSILAPVAKDPRVRDLAGSSRPTAHQHVVRQGETLYAIAFNYGLDFRVVAGWNAIPAPYVIYPGQRLRLIPGKRKQGTSMPVPDQNVSDSVVVKSEKQQTESSAQINNTANNQTTNADITGWIWPVKGRLITSFNQSGKKGIDINGELGKPVRATAGGKVVYSGGGLIGYGELIIIKHNKHYLSAYGHNDKLLVKQGDFVERGQHIATMGHSGADKVKLHFEIRRDGKPVDPIRYLPK